MLILAGVEFVTWTGFVLAKLPIPRKRKGTNHARQRKAIDKTE
jgi:hypothetical protein